ncbi:Che-14p [Parelaphostrongylus tenuis]|uniref:Che-14p n=1 Tax=Parelaphostrongylus tenuis TaxID=148309 RepID=A0AAD5RE01_PARTN|nr:Che-14p [Parelaphostrongylus tenuis]
MGDDLRLRSRRRPRRRPVASSSSPMSLPLNNYSRLLYRRPLLVTAVALLLTGLLPITVLLFHPITLSRNAEIGFDTKDTEYSGTRQAWQKLQRTLRTSNRIDFANRPPLIQARSETDSSSTSAPERVKRSWTDQLMNAFNKFPCYDSPIPLMNHLTQVVIEVPNLSTIFELDFLEKICSMHDYIAKELSEFDDVTPYRNIWSIANFISCLSPNFLFNCTELTVSDVQFVKELIAFCIPYRDLLISCKIACKQTCSFCPDVPQNCTSAMMFDLFYRLLPRDLSASPLYLNTFLPIFTLTGYATQNIFVTLDRYNDLEEAIVRFMDVENLVVKELRMAQVERSQLSQQTIACLRSLFSQKSIKWTGNGREKGQLVAGGDGRFLVGIAGGRHRRRRRRHPLPFTVIRCRRLPRAYTQRHWFSRLLFALHLGFSAPEPGHLRASHRQDSFCECLAHTSSTMFLTSFSTAVPFFVNIASNVVVFRCFGLFAGVTLLINYLLVISFLPAFLILQRKYCSCFPSLPDIGIYIAKSFKEVLPWVVVQGRYVWLTGLSIVAIFASIVSIRDLHLPEYNPLQLFIASNPHEWYDNNAEKTFAFVEEKIAIPLFVRLVWGVKAVNSTAMFQPDAVTPLEADLSFSLATPQDVRKLAGTLASYRTLPFINYSETFWPEKFLNWSDEYPCVSGFVCCNISHPLFNNVYLDYCLRNSTSFIVISYNDTPLFDNNSFALTGYTALLPTQLSYSHRFHRLERSFNLLGALSSPGGWWAPEWAIISTWYDLQRSIVSDVRSSVVVSISVVALFSLLQLKMQAVAAVLTCMCIIMCATGCVVLLGWEVGVLEAVIVVLVVGLSFDYTLHFGAALPKTGCKSHRIRQAANLASTPVSLSAFTSFLAGASMLFSQTHAFLQVGVFLIVLTLTSWIFATFFFLPLLFFTLSSQKQCDDCANLVVHSYQMNEKVHS